MDIEEYEYFDRQVESKMKWAKGDWFTLGWSQMYDVAQDKIEAGTLEKRWNADKCRIEFRAQ